MTSSPVCTCTACPVHARVPRLPAGSGLDAWPQWTGPALDHLSGVVAWLDGTAAMAADHGALEARLQVDSRETYRLLLQGHFDERARREPRLPTVTGSDAVARTRVEDGHCRGLMSVFGLVSVTRKAYRATPGSTPPVSAPRNAPLRDAPPREAAAAGTAPAREATSKTARNLYPADAVANLPPGRPSAGLARLAGVEAARGSFADARDAIERSTGVHLSKRQVEDLARQAAADIDAFYAARRPGPRPEAVLGLQCDGKGIVMRPGHLRPGTAKAAAAARRKLATRLSPGEKPGRKRMAEITCVYDLTPVPRTIDDIVADLTADPAATSSSSTVTGTRRRPGPTVSGKWLSATVIDDIPTAIAAMFDEADRRDPGHDRTWVALVDGNRQQIDAITAQASTRGVNVTILIDIIHVIEYVWGAAWTFYDKGEPAAQTWVTDHLRSILAGRAHHVAEAITRQADDGAFRGRERTGADAAAAYLTAKAAYLDYPTALARGWQIATGLIEGAARHLVKDRMDITGARWTTPGAQAVLALRALTSNGDFHAYWAFHQRQERRRNHLDRYQQPAQSDVILAA